jgi:hypothetical protein
VNLLFQVLFFPFFGIVAELPNFEKSTFLNRFFLAPICATKPEIGRKKQYFKVI